MSIRFLLGEDLSFSVWFLIQFFGFNWYFKQDVVPRLYVLIELYTGGMSLLATSIMKTSLFRR